MRRIWNDTFAADTAALTDELLARDWVRLDTNADRRGAGGLLPRPGVGYAMRDDLGRRHCHVGGDGVDANLQWMYLLDPAADTCSCTEPPGTAGGCTTATIPSPPTGPHLRPGAHVPGGPPRGRRHLSAVDASRHRVTATELTTTRTDLPPNDDQRPPLASAMTASPRLIAASGLGGTIA